MLRKLVVVLLTGVICLIGVTSALAVTYNEAPMLRTMVAAGELPPVEERLPEEPLVIPTVERIGQYGGTWNRCWGGPDDNMAMWYICQEPLIRFNYNGSKILPNIAKSWEASEDGKVFVFHLRKGIKWSDGTLFTAGDILYLYEDVLLNEELTPVFPGWLTVGEEPVKLERIDDYTVKFSFEAPYGLFLSMLAYQGGLFYQPKHYMKQFHPRYTPMDKLEEMAKKAEFMSWNKLYLSKSGWAGLVGNPEYPTILAWKVTVPSPALRVVMERNPYCWKVDPEGNQLPYIDRIALDLVQTSEMAVLKAVTGELDMQWTAAATEDFPILMANREKGNYRVFKWPLTDGWRVGFMLNQNCKDPILRKLFGNDRFRKALSLSINRAEINESVYLGLGKPQQASFMEGTPYFSEKWEKAYAEYDPKRADTLLDEIGLNERSAEGFRLLSDGTPINLIVDVQPVPDWYKVCELVKDYWGAIGIQMTINHVSHQLITTRNFANLQQVRVFSGFPIFPTCCDEPLPASPWCYWAPEYGRWYETKGEAGEKPTGDIAKLQELWTEIKITPDERKRAQLIDEFIELHIKNIWIIGTVGKIPIPVVVKNNFRNVPEQRLIDDTLRTPKNANVEQFFIEQ
ncbi:MAG: ABC transporter substrate-binding protein [Clostridia bacterium]|nr:ABC transporter substrate-binding protein [Clostridia bacterium]